MFIANLYLQVTPNDGPVKFAINRVEVLLNLAHAQWRFSAKSKYAHMQKKPFFSSQRTLAEEKVGRRVSHMRLRETERQREEEREGGGRER